MSLAEKIETTPAAPLLPKLLSLVAMFGQQLERNTEHRGYIQNLSGQKDPPVTARVNSLDLSTTHTPEPATLLLLGTGLMAALGARSHRKRKRR